MRNIIRHLFHIICINLFFMGIYASEYNRENEGLEEVPSDIPADVTRVSLAENKITQIKDGDLSEFTKLTKIDLSENKMTRISPLGFTDSVIEILDVYDNSLEEVPDLCALSQTLKYLRLDHNKIKEVDPDHISCLTNLVKLDLGNNLITDLPENAFTTLANLLLLYLNNCQITAIMPEVFRGTALVILKLYSNKLKTIPDICYLSDTMDELWLSRNSIDTVEPELINCLTKLSFLSIGNNPFKVLPNETFTGLIHLDVLGVSTTGISRFPDLANINVYALWMNYINLESFPDPALQNSSIQRVYMRNTYIVCDCSVAWLKKSSERGWPNSVKIFEKPCKAPPEVVDKKWADLSVDDLCSDG